MKETLILGVLIFALVGQQPIAADPAPRLPHSSVWWPGVLVAMQEPIPAPPLPNGEAYPGQSRHQQPPDGWFCYQADQKPEHLPAAHVCKCNRRCPAHPTDPEPPEDAACSVYCWKSYCRCGMCD